MTNTGDYDQFVNNQPKQTENKKSLPENYSGSGQLKVFLVASNGALPVSRAKVEIFTINEEKKELLFRLFSNYDGEVEAVTLETPAAANSLSPTEQAYAIYYIDITHPDYQTVQDAAVQIFPGVTTLFDYNLQPQRQVR